MTEQSNFNDDGANTGGERTSSRQRLIPLFAIALALMSVGFYLAIEQGNVTDIDQGDRPDLSELNPLEIPDEAIDTEVEPVELAHRSVEAHPVELMLHQKSRREDKGSGELQTVIELGLEEKVAEADAKRFDTDRVLAITRTYKRAQAEVTAGDDEAIGVGITSQVEELLRGSVTRMYVAPNGEPLDFEWREVPNPQARRMLYLVRDAHTFLTPRFFTGAVNPGDTWSYKRPMLVNQPDGDVSAEGEVTIDNRFVGVLDGNERRFAVVRQTLTADARGKLDAEQANAGFTLEGEGSGVVLVDLDANKIAGVDINFQRKLTVEAGDEPVVQSSEIFLALRPEGGLSLPEFRKEEDQHGHELEATKDHAEAE